MVVAQRTLQSDSAAGKSWQRQQEICKVIYYSEISAALPIIGIDRALFTVSPGIGHIE